MPSYSSRIGDPRVAERRPQLRRQIQFGPRRHAMKFFIDTADIGEIRELAATGLVDGVTTNPSLVAKSGRKFVDVVREICHVVQGPVSAEVTATDYDTMLAEGRKLAKIAPNIAVNVTLCFSPAQAILAAKCGAKFISPFVGRLDDIASDGLNLIRDIVQIYNQYPDFMTEVLVASVRHPIHIIETAKMGAHVATMPPSVLRQLFNHPLTDKGLAQFVADWAKTGQSILDKVAK